MTCQLFTTISMNKLVDYLYLSEKSWCIFIYLFAYNWVWFQIMNKSAMHCPDFESLYIDDQALTTQSRLMFLKFKQLNYPTTHLKIEMCFLCYWYIVFNFFMIDAHKIIGWALSYPGVTVKDSSIVMSSERLTSPFSCISIT